MYIPGRKFSHLSVFVHMFPVYYFPTGAQRSFLPAQSLSNNSYSNRTLPFISWAESDVSLFHQSCAIGDT